MMKQDFSRPLLAWLCLAAACLFISCAGGSASGPSYRIVTLVPGTTPERWTIDIRDTRSHSGATLWREGDLVMVALSPDGEWVVVSERVGEWSDLWLISADGRTEPRLLAAGEGLPHRLAWSPSGSAIAMEQSDSILIIRPFAHSPPDMYELPGLGRGQQLPSIWAPGDERLGVQTPAGLAVLSVPVDGSAGEWVILPNRAHQVFAGWTDDAMPVFMDQEGVRRTVEVSANMAPLEGIADTGVDFFPLMESARQALDAQGFSPAGIELLANGTTLTMAGVERLEGAAVDGNTQVNTVVAIVEDGVDEVQIADLGTRPKKTQFALLYGASFDIVRIQ